MNLLWHNFIERKQIFIIENGQIKKKSIHLVTLFKRQRSWAVDFLFSKDGLNWIESNRYVSVTVQCCPSVHEWQHNRICIFTVTYNASLIGSCTESLKFWATTCHATNPTTIKVLHFNYITYVFWLMFSVTRWLDYFFKIWPFTTSKICQNSISNLPKFVQNLAKYLMDSLKFSKVV